MTKTTQPDAPIDIFTPAVRERLPVKLVLYGPSKSGKTYSALMIARGVVGPEGRIAVLDTEGGKSRMYADDVPGGFSVARMGEPFNPERFVAMIDATRDAGYDCLVIDGASPEWEAVLQIADDAQTGKDQRSGWQKASPRHARFLRAIVASPIHLIVTCRVKTEWTIGADGKSRKVGLAPVQRGGFEYEFDIIGEIDRDHEITIEARGEFDGRVIPPSPDPVDTLVAFGAVLAAWMGHGEADHAADEFDPAAQLPSDQTELGQVVPE